MPWKVEKFWASRTGELSTPRVPLEARGGEHFSSQVLSFAVDAGTARRIEAVSATLKSSAADVLLAAWQALLWRLGGQTAFKIGAVFDGRQFEELQDAVGLFEKTLPIDSRFDGDFRFREVVGIRPTRWACDGLAGTV